MTDVGTLIENTLREHQILVHPAVERLGIPPVSAAVFEAMREHVRRSPKGVALFRGNRLTKDKHGRLIDGRARLAATLIEGRSQADLKYVIRDLSEDAVAKLLLVLALVQRHMTVGQRLLLVAKATPGSPRLMKRTLRGYGTSAQSVERAKRLLNSGNEALIAKVGAGQMTVSRAVLELNKHRAGAARLQDRTRRRRLKPNSAMSAWNRGWKELKKTERQLSTIRSNWRPSVVELKAIKALLVQISRIVKTADATR